METKKGTVQSYVREQWSKPDKHGNVIYTVAFDNGDVGWHRTKEGGNDYFTVGKEVDYEIERTTKTVGAETKQQTWIRIPAKEQQESTSKRSDGSHAKLEAKLRFVTMAPAYVKDLVIADKVEAKDMKPVIKGMIDYVFNLIDNI